jgi:hypothetical protein
VFMLQMFSIVVKVLSPVVDYEFKILIEVLYLKLCFIVIMVVILIVFFF